MNCEIADGDFDLLCAVHEWGSESALTGLDSVRLSRAEAILWDELPNRPEDLSFEARVLRAKERLVHVNRVLTNSLGRAILFQDQGDSSEAMACLVEAHREMDSAFGRRIIEGQMGPR